MAAFDDAFDAFKFIASGGKPQAPTTPTPRGEKGVELHGHKHDGRFYVRAEDVAELLDRNKVLPGIAAKLREV